MIYSNEEIKEKIKDMEYDPRRERYIGKDGSEFKVTPYSDGSGYKMDYYGSTTYNNEIHDSVHGKTDLNENWTRTANDRENGIQEKSSGSGCFLTTACMKHMKEDFDDNCYELDILRWFRDKFVSKEDKKEYYEKAPRIVSKINEEDNCNEIYNNIYENVIAICVKAIEYGKYDFAYETYKKCVLDLEENYVNNKQKVLSLV